MKRKQRITFNWFLAGILNVQLLLLLTIMAVSDTLSVSVPVSDSSIM